MTGFVLNERLEADTHLVSELEVCSLRLMDDARWSWLILVPRLSNIAEWHDLSKGQRMMVDDEVARTGKALQAVANCEKLNIANIGNMVRQMHIHVIARNKGDDNWPGPVWGFGQREPYDIDSARKFIETFRAEFS
jgi:diadenosine tetraphosphate (Ap4A) HIT family hydrolase